MNFNKGRQVGFIAQEVEGVLPEAVIKDEKDYYRVAYSEMAPLLVEAIKARQREIDGLKKLVCLNHPNAEICKNEVKK